MLQVTYMKGRSPQHTKRDELRRAAMDMIDQEVTKWVMRCKPENRREVKERIIQLMSNHDTYQRNTKKLADRPDSGAAGHRRNPRPDVW